jgi:hypothetical protein
VPYFATATLISVPSTGRSVSHLPFFFHGTYRLISPKVTVATLFYQVQLLRRMDDAHMGVRVIALRSAVVVADFPYIS